MSTAVITFAIPSLARRHREVKTLHRISVNEFGSRKGPIKTINNARAESPT
jgi:hypothetical protein